MCPFCISFVCPMSVLPQINQGSTVLIVLKNLSLLTVSKTKE